MKHYYFNSNLKYLREKHGLEQTDIADIVGKKSGSAISEWEKGIRIPDIGTIDLLANYFKVNIDDLMNKDFTGQISDKEIPQTLQLVAKAKPIPILGDIACGNPIWVNENYDGYFTLDNSMDADFILIARGDSMIEAGIAEGDKCFIKKKEEVRNGKIAVVLLDDSATLKRIYQTETGWILKAENKDFAPIIVEGDIHILGELVGVYKTYI